MLKKEIVDHFIVTKTSTVTGLVTQHEENAYDSKACYENAKHFASQQENYSFINSELGNFFFYFYDRLDKIEIKEQYKTRFIYLSSFIDYSNRLDDNSKFMTRNEIRFRLGLSDKETYNTIVELVDFGLIIKQEDGTYITNENYVIKGKITNSKDSYTKVFIDSVRSLYKGTKPTNHKQLYYFFKLLPYINKQYNVITKDVDEDEMCNICPLKPMDICSILGVDRTQHKRILKMLYSFTIGGEYVISNHRVNDNEVFAINPRLYYKGDNIDKLSFLIGIFDIAKRCTH